MDGRQLCRRSQEGVSPILEARTLGLLKLHILIVSTISNPQTLVKQPLISLCRSKASKPPPQRLFLPIFTASRAIPSCSLSLHHPNSCIRPHRPPYTTSRSSPSRRARRPAAGGLKRSASPPMPKASSTLSLSHHHALLAIHSPLQQHSSLSSTSQPIHPSTTIINPLAPYPFSGTILSHMPPYPPPIPPPACMQQAATAPSASKPRIRPFTVLSTPLSRPFKRPPASQSVSASPPSTMESAATIPTDRTTRTEPHPRPIRHPAYDPSDST